MITFKLFRIKEDRLYPLFINKSKPLEEGVWLEAELHETKGFAIRKGWHCCFEPNAPHLKIDLKSGEKRVWAICEALETESYKRPESQGGSWVLAQKIKIIGRVDPEVVKAVKTYNALQNIKEIKMFEDARHVALGSMRTMKDDEKRAVLYRDTGIRKYYIIPPKVEAMMTGEGMKLRGTGYDCYYTQGAMTGHFCQAFCMRSEQFIKDRIDRAIEDEDKIHA